MSKLSKNIIYNLVGQGLLVILSFVSTRYTFRLLGEEALGIIYFAQMLNPIIRGILVMGIASTVVREVSRYINSDPGYAHALIRTASLLHWGIYLLVAGALFFLAPLLVEKWIQLETLDPVTATFALQIMGIGAMLAIPNALYVSTFRGLEQMQFPNIIQVTAGILRQVGIILILARGGNLVQVIFWIATTTALMTLAYILLLLRFLPGRVLFPSYHPSVVKRNLGYVGNMMLTSIFVMVNTQADKVIVSKLLPIGFFAYYTVAYSAISRSALLRSAVGTASLPSLASLFETGDREKLMAQYRKLHDLLCLGLVPFYAVIPFAALPLFGYIFNPDVARLILVPITFLMLGYYMDGTLGIPHHFSIAVGRPDIGARANFFALFITLPATAILVYFLGLTGAGISWVLYHLFMYAYAVPRICSECLKISVWSWYRHIFRIMALIGATYGGAWVLLVLLGKFTMLSLSLAYASASLVFLAGAYLLVGKELRQALLQFTRVLKKKAREFTHSGEGLS